MLTALSIKNFKSWHQIDSMRLAPITGLFGANSSGKTSILQLLLMLKQTVESPDRTQVLNFGDERSLVSLGSFRELVYRHEADSPLHWDLQWKLAKELLISDPEKKNAVLFRGDSLAFSAQIIENGAGRILPAAIRYSLAGHSFRMSKRIGKNDTFELTTAPDDAFHFVRTKGRAWDLPAPTKSYGFPDQVKAYYQNAGFLSDLQLEFERLFSGVYYLGPLREYPKRQYTWAGARPADMGQRGERVVDALLASRDQRSKISRGKGKKKLSLEECVAYWLRELKLIHSFSVKPIKQGSNVYCVWVQRSPGASEVLITDVGFGVSQILPVLALCYYVPEGSVIILEQPEIHLHPTVQAGLADVFIDAIKTRNIQIIIESHSEHLLQRLQRRVAEEEFAATDTALYFCKTEKGTSRLVDLDVDMFGVIQNWPEEFFGDEYKELAATQRAIMTRKKRDSESGSR